MKLIARFILWIFGWKVEGYVPPETQKCVLVSGPHTSNWDTVFAVASMHSLGIPMRVAIKKFWMRYPQRLIVRPVGGIAVDTNNKKFSRRLDQIEAMADLFESRDKIALMISPEGNRDPVRKWKLGFYMIAKKAEVPIVLAFLDYEKKIGGFGPVFKDLEDKNLIMKNIMEFYNSKAAKFPDKFIPDSRYFKPQNALE